MALFQMGIDVSRYQGSINWSAVAAAGKQFAIVRIGSSNNNGAYVDPYFLQNVNGAHAAGLRVGAYYYTYARTESAVARELTTFLNALEGLQLEYPVFVDVEARSLASLGKPQLTNLVKYAMDILNQRKWYAGWYSYTNYINSYMNASALANYPLWVADYRSSLGYTGSTACGSIPVPAPSAVLPARWIWITAIRTICPRYAPGILTGMAAMGRT